MILKKRNRKFKVGSTKKNITLTDSGSIFLKDNENINMHYNKKISYDICKKNWGFYCLPSINSRLINSNLEPYLFENTKNKKFFIFLVVNKKKAILDFKRYCKKENLKIVVKLNNKNLLKIKKYFA